MAEGWAWIDCQGCGAELRTRLSGESTTCRHCRARTYVPVGLVRSRVWLTCRRCGHTWQTTAAEGTPVPCAAGCGSSRRVPQDARADDEPDPPAPPPARPRAPDLAARAARAAERAAHDDDEGQGDELPELHPRRRRRWPTPGPLPGLPAPPASRRQARRTPQGRPLPRHWPAGTAPPGRPAQAPQRAPQRPARAEPRRPRPAVHGWALRPDPLPGRCALALRPDAVGEWCQAHAEGVYMPSRPGDAAHLTLHPLPGPAGGVPLCEAHALALARHRAIYNPAP